MKPKLLLIGYRAFGDWLHTAPVLPYLFKDYDVHMEVNVKGLQLFWDDPRPSKVTVYPFERYPANEWPERFEARWKQAEEYLKPDRVININGSIETECMITRDQEEFHLPVGERRGLANYRCFYDYIFARCGLTMGPDVDLAAGIHFGPEVRAWGDAWAEKNKETFCIAIPLHGSVFFKYLPCIKELLLYLRKKEKVKVWLFGMPHELPADFPLVETERFIDVSTVPYKQSVYWMSKMDYVVGPETGLMIAAGMFGTPKTIFATQSNVNQMTAYQKNDFSFQAFVPCSPCHRAVYGEADCELPAYKGGKFYTTGCTVDVPVEPFISRFEWVYADWERCKTLTTP